MAVSLTNKQSATEQQQEWIDNIAPKYFDFNNTSTYRAGIFGYVNEVMSEVSEDAYNAVRTVRREFYPNSANYNESLYRMAALQQLDAPMATPATCKAALVIKEEDILPTIISSTNMDHSFYIDNNMIFMVDKIPFMIDHPIIITGKPNTQTIATPAHKSNIHYTVSDMQREKYAYTTRYDLSKGVNSLDKSNKLYLENKVMFQYGERVLLIQVTLRQVQRQVDEIILQKNAQIEIVTQDIVYSGQIANFEVFYKENDGTPEIQLQKQILGAETPTTPFCQYMILSNGRLRLHFPKNIYFTPKFNSTIRVEIYTTLGEDGNFDSFNGDLTCNTESADFPKNNSIIISGRVIGPCAGGTSIGDFEDFRRDVVYAYTTNKTICTDHDLQAYFDKLCLDTRNKVLFFKKRDDVFQRLYGAFTLMKNENGYVVPTNTLDMRLMRGYIDSDGNLSDDSDFDSYYESSKRLTIKPGAIFRYGDANSSDRFTLRRDKSLSLLKDLSTYEDISNGIRSACRHMYDGLDIPMIEEITSDHFAFRFHTEAEILDMPNYKEIADEETYFTKLKDDIIQYLTEKTNLRNVDLTKYIRIYHTTYMTEYYPEMEEPEENEVSENTSFEDIIASDEIYDPPAPKEDPLPIVYTYIEYHISISYFLYTNPFLISMLTSPNAVAYYLTSANETLPCSYSEVASGSDSYVQFIMSNLHVNRNALLGENFFKFTINIMASVDMIAANGMNELVSKALDEQDYHDNTNYIVAQTDGHIESVKYYRSFKNADGTVMSFSTVADLEKYIDEMHYLEDDLVNSIAHIANLDGHSADMIWDPNKDCFIEQTFSTFSGVYDGVYARAISFSPDRLGNYWSVMIRISPVIEFDNMNKAAGFSTIPGFKMLYQVGERFTQGDQIALKNAKDNGIIKAFMTINGPEFELRHMHIPLICEEYVEEGDYFVMSAYVMTDDELASNGTMHLVDGIYYDKIDKEANIHDWHEVDEKMCYIEMDHTDFDVYTFIRYDDVNNPKYTDYLYVKNDSAEDGQWTFTNKYTINSETTGFALIRPVEYIRSVSVATMQSESTYVIDRDDPEPMKDRPLCKYIIKSSPVIKADWVKSVANSQYLSTVIRRNYNIIRLIYNYLEENFSIDMKFYNTYGRSRFYRVGNKNEVEYMKPLDRVNIDLRIGVNVDTLSSYSVLQQRLYDFIREYIESLNTLDSNGRPIYLLNLMSAVKQNFEEIGYTEYYGINDYGSDIQRIESTYEDVIVRLGYNEYVPEFINITENGKNGIYSPSISVTLLDV